MNLMKYLRETKLIKEHTEFWEEAQRDESFMRGYTMGVLMMLPPIFGLGTALAWLWFSTVR